MQPRCDKTVMDQTKKPATIAAHAAGAVDPQSGGVVPALQPSTTYLRDEDYALIRPDNIYSRADSDNLRQAEEVLRRRGFDRRAQRFLKDRYADKRRRGLTRE